MQIFLLYLITHWGLFVLPGIVISVCSKWDNIFFIFFSFWSYLMIHLKNTYKFLGERTIKPLLKQDRVWDSWSRPSHVEPSTISFCSIIKLILPNLLRKCHCSKIPSKASRSSFISYLHPQINSHSHYRTDSYYFSAFFCFMLNCLHPKILQFFC